MNVPHTVFAFSPTTRQTICCDTDVLVFAAARSTTPLGGVALREIHRGQSFITPNQLREFVYFKGITSLQRKTRFAFLRREGIQLLRGSAARRIAGTQSFQRVFRAIAPSQGRGDAALAAFALATGYEALTANSRLVNFIYRTLNVSTRTQFPTIPIRNLRGMVP